MQINQTNIMFPSFSQFLSLLNITNLHLELTNLKILQSKIKMPLLSSHKQKGRTLFWKKYAFLKETVTFIIFKKHGITLNLKRIRYLLSTKINKKVNICAFSISNWWSLSLMRPGLFSLFSNKLNHFLYIYMYSKFK